MNSEITPDKKDLPKCPECDDNLDIEPIVKWSLGWGTVDTNEDGYSYNAYRCNYCGCEFTDTETNGF